jgi:hypothetical protein
VGALPRTHQVLGVNFFASALGQVEEPFSISGSFLFQVASTVKRNSIRQHRCLVLLLFSSTQHGHRNQQF